MVRLIICLTEYILLTDCWMKYDLIIIFYSLSLNIYKMVFGELLLCSTFSF